MQADKISYAEFARSEGKRAANRLRDQWKNNPWVHGRTVDVLEHEIAFQGELLHWNGSRRLAPAILDWRRWKFRRLQIDQAQNDLWAMPLRDQLPRRAPREPTGRAIRDGSEFGPSLNDKRMGGQMELDRRCRAPAPLWSTAASGPTGTGSQGEGVQRPR